MKHTVLIQIKIYKFLQELLFMKHLVDQYNKHHRAY
jgi:hypothetical protein